MKRNLIFFIILFFVLKAEAQTSAFAVIDSVLKTGNYKRALALLQKESPSNFEANVKTAKIYEMIDEHQKAISFYQKALSINQKEAVKISLGTLYRKIGKDKKTIELFEEVLTSNPENLLLQYQLGKLYLKNAKATKAIALFQDLIQKDPQNANYSYQLAKGYALKKKRDLMIDAYLDAHQKDKTHLKTLFQLSNIFYKINKKDSAFLFIRKGLQIDKNHENLNKLKANLFFRKKEYQKAISVLNHLDTIIPNDTFTQNMLGKSYNNLRDYESAKKYFLKSAKLDPSDYKILTYLGNIELEQGNFKAAQFTYFRAVIYGKVPMDDEYLGIAVANLKLGDKKIALKYLNKAYDENTMNHDVIYQLALLEDSLSNDKKKAYKLYKRYMDYHQNKDAEQTAFIKARIKEIQRDYFFRGEKLE